MPFGTEGPENVICRVPVSIGLKKGGTYLVSNKPQVRRVSIASSALNRLSNAAPATIPLSFPALVVEPEHVCWCVNVDRGRHGHLARCYFPSQRLPL